VNPVLAATSISVRIGGKTLLDDVSLSLGFGEIVALVGPNGAGKSTLLRVLSGDLAPHAGTVRLNGRTLASYGPRALAGRRAVLSQSLNVAFPFTVAEIVRMGAGDGRGRRIDDLVEAALAEVDLDPRARHHHIIGGRAAARAFREGAGSARVRGSGAWSGPAAARRAHSESRSPSSTRRDGRGQCAGRSRRDGGCHPARSLAALLAKRIVVLDHGRIDSDGEPGRVITDAMLERVLGVANAVGRTPAEGTPFVLPHAARKLLPGKS